MYDLAAMIAIFIVLQIVNLPLYGLIARAIFGKDGPQGFYGAWECFSEYFKHSSNEEGFSSRDVKSDYFMMFAAMLVLFECSVLYLWGAHHLLGKLFQYMGPYLQRHRS